MDILVSKEGLFVSICRGRQFCFGSVCKLVESFQVLLGDVGAGKSSLVLRFVKDQFVEFQVGGNARLFFFFL